MKKKAGMSVLLSTLLLTSCGSNIRQKNWHINTLELANEYFPKYFDAFEESLQKNDIQYEKKYSGSEYVAVSETNQKYYNVYYNITDTIYFLITLTFSTQNSNFSNIRCRFFYENATEEEMLNISQSYINFMIDVTDFCAYNLLGTGEQYKTYYNEVKTKLQCKEYDWGTSDHFGISIATVRYDYLIYRSVGVIFYENTFSFEMELIDYLTDVNIWDKSYYN